ncbi:MAG: sulfate transporter CysZ [Gammaproteobacteria bacterium]
MLTRFLDGFSCVIAAMSLLFKAGIRKYVIVPLLINVMIFGGLIWFGLGYFQTLLDTLTDWTPAWLDWIQWLLWPLAVIMVLIIVYYSFTVVANLIAAPFNSFLSQRVEKFLSGGGDTNTAPAQSIAGMAGRTLWSEVRKILYQLKWLIGLLLITFIPGVNLVAPFAWAYFGIWMLSIEYADYPMGNHGLYFAEVKKTLKQDKPAALGLGAGIMLLTLVPGLNFLAMPTGVIGGTLYWVRRTKA